MPTQLFCQHQHTSCYSTLINEHNGYIWKRRYQWCPVETFAKKIQQEIERDASVPEWLMGWFSPTNTQGDPEQAMLNMIQSARTQTYTLHLLMVSPERYTVSGDERVEHLCYTLGPLKRKVLLLHRLTDSTVRQRLSIISRMRTRTQLERCKILLLRSFVLKKGQAWWYMYHAKSTFSDTVYTMAQKKKLFTLKLVSQTCI